MTDSPPPPPSQDPPAIRLHNDEYKEDEPPEFTEERSYVFEGRIERAREVWQLGKQLFKDKRVADALQSFKLALYHADFDELSYQFELMDKHRAEVDSVRIPLWLNCSHCWCVLFDGEGGEGELHVNAIEYCNLAIKADKSNAKAWFRRARARECLQEWDLAVKDLEQALTLLSSTGGEEKEDVQRALKRVRQLQRKEQKEVDSMWKGKALFPAAVDNDSKKKEEEEEETVAAAATTTGLWTWLTALLAWLWALVAGGGGGGTAAAKRD